MKQLTCETFENGTPFTNGKDSQYYRYLNGKIYQYSMDSDRMTSCLGSSCVLNKDSILAEYNRFAIEIKHFGQYERLEYFFSHFHIYEHPNSIPFPEN